MALRILVVPDKFKGTLTAREAAEAIAAGWRKARPDDLLELLPMSDGGDGFGEVMSELLHAPAHCVQTVDAAHHAIEATWWHEPRQRRAIIESARIIGLALLPPKKFHPFDLDTAGLSAVIDAAEQNGASLVLMGVGGSATNDAGFGLARAAGWQFLDSSGHSIEQWTQLVRLQRILAPPPPRQTLRISVAVDVQNPLLGPNGASHVYGPQKGLRPDDMPVAEACLTRLAEIVQRDLGIDARAEPGTGAAGGLGYGLRCFFDARLESGFSLFARLTGLESKVRSADLVLTGEGALDRSTLMGKGVGQIAQLCAKSNVPCIGLSGQVSLNGPLPGPQPFTHLAAIAPNLAPVETAIQEPKPFLSDLAADVAKSWRSR